MQQVNQVGPEGELPVAVAAGAAGLQGAVRGLFKGLTYLGLLSGMQRKGRQRNFFIALSATLVGCMLVESIGFIIMLVQKPVQQSLDSGTTLLILSVFYHFYSGFIYLCFLWVSCNGQLDAFLKEFDAFVGSTGRWPALGDATSAALTSYLRLFRQMLAGFLAISVINGALSTALFFVAPNQPPFVFNIRLTMVQPTDEEPLPTIENAPWPQILCQTVASLWWTYKFLVLFFCCLLQFVLVLAVSKLLTAFNAGLREQIRRSSGLTAEVAAAYRQFYTRILALVDSADSLVRGYILATSVFSLIAIMFNSNSLLDARQSGLLVVVILLVWLASSVFLMTLPILVAGRLQNLTKVPLEILREQEVTKKNFQEVVVFMQTVGSSSSGITCGGLFTIDYSLIVSLTGLLLTYFILIVQTRQSSTPACSRNFTYNA